MSGMQAKAQRLGAVRLEYCPGCRLAKAQL